MIQAQYKTSDIVLASCLKYAGHQLIDVEISGPRGTFVFTDVDTELLSQFDMGNLQVEPNSFHHTVKQLTAIVRRKMNS